MRIADQWKDYEIIDTSGGEKLERWGDVLLIRPDPQIIWNTPKTHSAWKKADARYIRSNAGGGSGSAYITLEGPYDQKGISSSYADDGNKLGKIINAITEN